MNLAGLVRHQARARPSKIAIEFSGQAITYHELWRCIANLAARLQRAGVVKGTRVGVSLADHPQHAASFFAVAGLGAVLVPLDHRWLPAERAQIIAAFGVTHCLHDEGAHEAQGVHNIACTPLGDARAGAEFLTAEGDDEDWLISLSSGSTGRPKGARVTHKQMHARFVTQWVSLGFSSGDRCALVTPLHFGAGRSFAMSVLASGATVIILPPPMKPPALVAAITRARATTTFLVPSLMRRLLALPGDDLLLPTLRGLVISGEAFFADEVDDFRRRLSPYLLGYYASSEGGGITVLQSDDFARHGDTVGQAVYGVELELVDDMNQRVHISEVGRVRYRGPGVTTRALDEDGEPIDLLEDWFYPGDLASMSRDGYLKLQGRAKDMIVRAGVNVYPSEIENAIAGYDGVTEVAVVGTPSASHGEQVIAFFTGTADASDLVEHCQKTLAPYKRPAEIHRLDVLPKTAAAKTDKAALREQVATHLPGAK